MLYLSCVNSCSDWYNFIQHIAFYFDMNKNILCFQARIPLPLPIKGTELNCKLQDIQIDYINDQVKKNQKKTKKNTTLWEQFQSEKNPPQYN